MRSELSQEEVRRVALAAQGFGAARTNGSAAKVRRIAGRLGAFQIDSVNVLVRAHYMPAFSRLGPYSVEALDRLTYRNRHLFEYWGHAACLLPAALYPLFRWRMDAASRFYHAPAKHRHFLEAVYQEVAERGPLGAGELSIGGKSKGGWWGWSDGKQAVEVLFRQGRLAVAGRRNFERLYDLSERVIPAELLAAPVPTPDEARKDLLVFAAKALGVGTAQDIASYFHLDAWWDRPKVDGKRAKPETPRLVRELVEEGRLLPVAVEGWSQPAYVAPGGLKVPGRVEARSLVSPFDPLVWERKRTKRIFDFDYTIEIYVPEPKRKFGYYVLPFLMGDRLVARVDLKADRKSSILRVLSAFVEPGHPPARVVAGLAAELKEMARWLGLERVSVGRRGDLARDLSRAVGASSGR